MRDIQIAISGNIGVGKSGLCARLAEELGARADLEEVSGNPHFESFYADPSSWAFSSQLAFAADATARHIRAQDGLPVVIDRTIYESVDVFARMLTDTDVLTSEQFQVLERLALNVRHFALQPALLIHLTAPTAVLLQRIAGRERKAEAAIDGPYLDRLEDHYESFLATWDLCPVLRIDTVEHDLRRPAAVEGLARRSIDLLSLS